VEARTRVKGSSKFCQKLGQKLDIIAGGQQKRSLRLKDQGGGGGLGDLQDYWPLVTDRKKIRN